MNEERRKQLAEWGRKGGKKSKLGYWGWLKIHDPEKLKMLQDKGRKNRIKKAID